MAERPTSSDADESIELDEFAVPGTIDARTWWIAGGVVAILVVSFVVFLAFGERLRGWWRGERTLGGDFVFEPSAPVSDSTFKGMDLKRVHTELFPSWVIAASRAETEAEREREEARFATLREAVSADDNLTELLDEMRGLVIRGDVVENADRLYYLTWAWTTYLDQHDQPFIVQSNVMVSRTNSFFYVKVYEKLADVVIPVGDGRHRTRIVRRIDGTNVVEQYLGATSKDEDGALVVVDRVVEFAMNEVWPALDAANDPRLDAVSRAFAEDVRREASEQLPKRYREVLEQTAGHRLDMLETVDAIMARRSCGSRFMIRLNDFRGLPPADLRSLESYVGRGAPDCPDLTRGEADILRTSSEALQEEEELADAMRALVAWIARGVAVHEARHVADDELYNGLETPLDCSECPHGARVRAELSAYLASFAWTDAPMTTLFQACAATDGQGGSHALAIDFVQKKLGRPCYQGPPDELSSKARGLERSLFGRAQRITLPESFPKMVTLPVSP